MREDWLELKYSLLRPTLCSKIHPTQWCFSKPWTNSKSGRKNYRLDYRKQKSTQLPSSGFLIKVFLIQDNPVMEYLFSFCRETSPNSLFIFIWVDDQTPYAFFFLIDWRSLRKVSCFPVKVSDKCLLNGIKLWYA